MTADSTAPSGREELTADELLRRLRVPGELTIAAAAALARLDGDPGDDDDWDCDPGWEPPAKRLPQTTALLAAGVIDCSRAAVMADQLSRPVPRHPASPGRRGPGWPGGPDPAAPGSPSHWPAGPAGLGGPGSPGWPDNPGRPGGGPTGLTGTVNLVMPATKSTLKTRSPQRTGLHPKARSSASASPGADSPRMSPLP
jgi:hypothetical protein